jgi:CBS domain containing-hemolysin-like protein
VEKKNNNNKLHVLISIVCEYKVLTSTQILITIVFFLNSSRGENAYITSRKCLQARHISFLYTFNSYWYFMNQYNVERISQEIRDKTS